MIRNKNKFPEDFYFQLTKEEFENLRFQIGTANKIITLPHVFTESGVAMLATVLHTDNVINTSVNIIRALVVM